LNAEVSADDSKERIRRMYDREEYEEYSKALRSGASERQQPWVSSL